MTGRGNGEPAQRLTVLGGGVMGSGIAALALGHGMPVVLVDTDAASAQRAQAAVRQHLRRAQLMRTLPDDRAPGTLVTSSVAVDGRDATVVIEAVTERVGAKAEALRRISGLVAPGTPLVTNTSGIPVGELSDAVPRPGDLVGVHFMNPPYLIQTVEVIRARQTSDEAMARVRSFLGSLRREGIEVSDAPGFVTSRLLHPMINESARIVGAGLASAEAVDALMRRCLGHAMGPLATADLIGIDNLVDALNALYERTGQSAHQPCEVLLEMTRAGRLGRKAGRGFYDYGETF